MTFGLLISHGQQSFPYSFPGFSLLFRNISQASFKKKKKFCISKETSFPVKLNNAFFLHLKSFLMQFILQIMLKSMK